MKSNSKLILAKTNDYSKTDTPQQTVVMIHGIAATSASYDSALKYFKNAEGLEKFRFVTFDLLGAGKSLTDDSLKYNYEEQLEALHTAISELEPKTPIVLIGHSLGTFIVTRYAKFHPESVKQLILVSPPIYSEKDLDNPAFRMGMRMFNKAVDAIQPGASKQKSFVNSMKNIVLARDNYQTLAETEVPTVLIYGTEDQIIASYNIPGILKKNQNIKAVSTTGQHGVTEDKFTQIAAILKESINETI